MIRIVSLPFPYISQPIGLPSTLCPIIIRCTSTRCEGGRGGFIAPECVAWQPHEAAVIDTPAKLRASNNSCLIVMA